MFEDEIKIFQSFSYQVNFLTFEHFKLISVLLFIYLALALNGNT